MSPHSPLHDELARLADTQPAFRPDPAVWDRGRRARRRTRVVAGGAALAVVAVVGGLGSLAARPEAVGPAGGEVPDGVIPSVITESAVVTDGSPGRSSVAFVGTDGMPVLVDARTGESRQYDLSGFPEPAILERLEERGPLLALSPDGRRLAYPVTSPAEAPDGSPSFVTSFYRVTDLTTGDSDLVDLPPNTGMPLALSWTHDGELAADTFGRATSADEPPPVVSWTVDPETGASSTSPLLGVVAPGQGISATYPDTDAPVAAIPFVTSSGTDLSRALPTDLYPDGASVTPVGWADDSLLVAEVDAPPGSYVEGPHLVLLTSPDRPESEWTWRILVRDVPDTSSLSLAVDLVPDLDGTSSQVLTHDFGASAQESPRGERAPYLLGGLVALLAGLAFVRMLRHQA